MWHHDAATRRSCRATRRLDGCGNLRAQPPRALPRRSLESDERVRPGNEPRELPAEVDFREMSAEGASADKTCVNRARRRLALYKAQAANILNVDSLHGHLSLAENASTRSRLKGFSNNLEDGAFDSELREYGRSRLTIIGLAFVCVCCRIVCVVAFGRSGRFGARRPGGPFFGNRQWRWTGLLR